MEEIKTFAPARGFRRGYWFRGFLSLLLICLALWIFYRRAEKALLLPEIQDLGAEVQAAAEAVAAQRNDLKIQFIALAEQRSLRDGINKLRYASTSGHWRDGFLQAMDATCRSLVAQVPNIRECSLRDLEGNKMAGTGVIIDPVTYANVMHRVQIERIDTPGDEKTLERWVVPIRDEAADPLAFLVAEVRPLGSEGEIKRLIKVQADARYCLIDGEGGQLWDHGKLFTQPEFDFSVRQYETEGTRYTIHHAPVPGTNWELYVAFPYGMIQEQLRSLRLLAVELAVVAAIILLAVTLSLAKQMKRS